MEGFSNDVSYGQTNVKMMLGHLSYKLEAAIKYAAKVSVYSGDITRVELNTAQYMILALFHGLLIKDLDFCQVLQQLFTKVELLKSPYLISWLRDDFRFKDLDVVRVLSKLASLVKAQKLIVPDYILRAFVALKTKYGVIEICNVMNDMDTINFLMSVEGTCTRSQQTDPIPVPLPLKPRPRSYYNLVDQSSSNSMPNFENRSWAKSTTRNDVPLGPYAISPSPSKSPPPNYYSSVHVPLPPYEISALPAKSLPPNYSSYVNVTKDPKHDSGVDSGSTQQSSSNSMSNVKNRSRAKLTTRNHVPLPPYEISALPAKSPPLNYSSSVNVTKDPNCDSGVDSGSTQQSSSNSIVNVENRNRARSRTRNHNVPRGKSRTGENTGRNYSEFKGTTLKHAKSSPNIVEQLSKDAELSLELALVHSFLSRSGPISPSDIRRFAVRKDRKGGTYPIQQAARDGLIDIVKALIAVGAPVDCKDDEGHTAAHYAAQAGNINILELLKLHGADLSALGDNGSTLLHLASWNNHSETCKWLINHGVPIEAQGYKGRTALHRAAMWGHIDTVQLLIGHGASIHVKDFYKNTAYDLALAQGHLLVANMLKIK